MNVGDPSWNRRLNSSSSNPPRAPHPPVHWGASRIAVATVAPLPRIFGYAGPATAKATEAFQKYIIIDMFAKAAQGMKPEDAVKWAEGEMRKIYEA